MGGGVAAVLILLALYLLTRRRGDGSRRGGRGYFGLGESGGYQPPPMDNDSIRSSASLHSYTAKIPTERDFRPLKTLGCGAFGKVVLVRHKRSNRVFALKVTSKARTLSVGTSEVEKVLLEARLLRVLCSPFLVALQFAFQSDDRLFYVFEFARGGQLLFHLRRERMFPLEVRRCPALCTLT